MSAREMFGEFLDNLKLDAKQAKKISYHYRKITKSLNLAVRGNNYRIANRLKVGSVGRHTAIKGISDLDMLYIMPQAISTITKKKRTDSPHCLTTLEIFWPRNTRTK